MIFKHLFVPKYKHSDPKVRIQAIEGLSPENPEQKTQLHELAFNDEDPKVILAALTKLNSFPLWNKIADTSKLERVRKKARLIVEEALMGEGSLSISAEEKRTFVVECKNNSLLEKLLKQPWLIEGETKLVLQVLSTLDKSHLTHQVFFNQANEPLQLALIEDFKDEATLQKVVKKSRFSSVKAIADKALAEIKANKAIPVALEKQVRLVLSQLLALKEKQDLPYIQKRRDELQKAFSEARVQFSVLDQALRESLENKYDDIVSKLDSLEAQLKPQWLKQQQLSQYKLDIAQAENSLHGIINKVSEALAKGAQSITLGEVEAYEHSLQQVKQNLKCLSEQVPASEAALHRQTEGLFNQLNKCKSTLESLPEFQQAIESAKGMIENFKELSLPTDISQIDAASDYLKEQKHNWKSLTTNFRQSWPQDLQNQWKEVAAQWESAVGELKKRLKEDVIRCKSKIRVIENMIAQGRFKPAMGLFKKVNSWYQELPEFQQRNMSRQFEKVKDQVENLIDWQDYIAEPRKPALLSEAESLVSSPLKVEEQAEAVKRLRQEWNTLGKVDSESDQALNLAFEQTLEKAFEPCRAYYAQKQEVRERNLKDKYAIIERIKGLAEQNFDDAKLASEFKGLQNQWQKSGEIDFRLMDEVHNAYRTASQVIKGRIDEYYDQNAELKQKLIHRAEKLLEVEEVHEAVESAKALQDEWKKIGASSRKQEGKLWSAFRAVNDKVFARRKDQQLAVKQDIDDKVEQLNELINRMSSALESAPDKQAIHHALDELEQGQALTSELPAKIRGRFDKKLSQLQGKQKDGLAKWKEKQQSDEFRTLFAGLSQWTETSLPDNLETIANPWKGCFRQVVEDSKRNRQEITIKLEILADKPSPEGEANLRQDIQLKMMAEKLEHGQQQDKQVLLKQWIQQGPLSEEELSLLTRVENIFIPAR